MFFDPYFNGIYAGEYLTFDMYFSSLCAMQVHPGAGSKEHKILSFEECKIKAIEMLIIRRSLSSATITVE